MRHCCATTASTAAGAAATISHGASLAVLAGPDGKMGLIAYEMALLVERAGRMITPAARDSDQAATAPSRR